MASVPIPPVHCKAETEKPLSRVLRIAGTCLLAAQALLLTGAGLMTQLGMTEGYRAGDLLFVAVSGSLLACSLWSFRDAASASRWLFLACLADFIALFFTGYAHGAEGLTIKTGTTVYMNPTLTLAGLILMSMVLSRFVRWSATKAACNCG